eukprot:365288-Chlamydomonas_euryale.AAC.4
MPPANVLSGSWQERTSCCSDPDKLLAVSKVLLSVWGSMTTSMSDAGPDRAGRAGTLRGLINAGPLCTAQA